MTETLTTAVTTGLSTIKSDVLDMFEVALPAGLAICGIGLAVTLAIKFFKKISK